MCFVSFVFCRGGGSLSFWGRFVGERWCDGEEGLELRTLGWVVCVFFGVFMEGFSSEFSIVIL